MIQSFKTFDRWIVASACLLLAGKVEETPKKCKDILKVAKAQLTEHQWVKFGADPKVRTCICVSTVGLGEGRGGEGRGWVLLRRRGGTFLIVRGHMGGDGHHMTSALRRSCLPMKEFYYKQSSLTFKSSIPMPTSSNLLKL